VPEGVEVRISSELIKPLVQSKYISKIRFDDDSRYGGPYKSSPEGYEKFVSTFRKLENIGYVVEPLKIIDVKCKGKFMYWQFDNGWYMYCTFGMTGQWSPTAGKHVCLHMKLYDDEDNFSNVYFNDPRHFGTIKFIETEAELKAKLNELGWDPLSGSVDKWVPWLKSELTKSKKPIGQVLLDQAIFAGVGNYIRAEALYASQISPWRISNTLSGQDTEVLCKAIVDVMEESYKWQGATLLTYKDAYGNEGKYASCFKVYGKKIDPFGNLIKSEPTPDGRTIHWCPTIQK
jgi:formamidopyrimidine-DNA glycosylase